MESPEPEKRPQTYGSSSAGETRGASVVLFVRLWAYGGPAQPLSGLFLENEPQITELVGRVIREARGIILESQTSNLCVACFEDAVLALSAAKALQQRFLTFHGESEAQQIVPSILISSAKTEDADASRMDADNVLGNVSSSQILIAGSVYEMVKSVPGFQFSAKLAREAGQSSDADGIYELLWTDESTYGHLRQAIQSRLNTIGRYQIQEELGRGAMGAVYKAYDQLIARTVALKIIPIDRNTPDRVEMIERLKQEAKAAGKLDHPNIITIYDVGQEEDVVYLSMQFLEGETLLTLLAETGVPPLARLISWADQICSAVGYAHAHGVIHRDLKPANLILTKQGIIKVLDFGIAKVESSSLTQTGLVVGTPSHMAPEQVAGKRVDHRVDIFALGSLFYELVTREKPFRGDITTILYKIVYEDPVAPSLVNPALPGGIDAIIRKALAKDPEERFQSCEEMRNAFLQQAALLKITPAPSMPAGSVASKLPSRPSSTLSFHLLEDSYMQRSRGTWPSVLAVLALGIVAAASWAVYSRPSKGSATELVKRVATRARGTWQQLLFQHLQGLGSSGQQPHSVASERAAENTTNEEPGIGTGAIPSGGAIPASAQRSPLAAVDRTGASGAALPTRTTTQNTVSEPLLGDGSQLPRAAPPLVSAPKPSDDQRLTAASDQHAKRSILGTQQDNNDGSQESVPAQEQGSAKLPATSGGEEGAVSSSQPGAVAKNPMPEPALVVDGFTRHDIPELLLQAEVAAARGDYRLARYEYKLILKLDPGNATAGAQIRRIKPAQEWH